MQTDNNKISLRQLKLIEFQPQGEDRQAMNNPFALYLSANAQFWGHNDQELLARDTNTLPMRPIRRRACQQCLSQNLKCQMCQRCHIAGKTCCRSIDCIYELSKYLSNQYAQIYKKCGCCKTFQPSSQQFAIDWRLFYLMQKLGQFKILSYSYFVHNAFDTLFISEQEVDQTQNTRKINRIIFEQSYSIKQNSELKNELKQQNLIEIKRLFQRNVLKYIKKFEDWEEDNIQGTCHEIIQQFQSNQHMQKFKTKMESVSVVGEHEYISGCSLSIPKKYINVIETTSKINYNRFQGLSSAVNKNLLFFYHNDSRLLIVKNAEYEQKQTDTTNIKIYGIMSDTNYDLSGAVWFKDRKGDIFAIHQHFISIFKFHLEEKKFKQIVLRQDKFYQNIVSVESIVYVAQTDRVYFFDHNNFGRCYYFELYRPYLQQKYFSDCLNVNPWITMPGRISLFSELLFVKAVTVMQEVILPSKQAFKNEKQSTNHLQFIPVIYLLSVRKQPQQICKLYRLIHFQQFYEIKQVKATKEGEWNERELNPNIGIFAVFKKEKQICVCMQTEIDGNPKLVEGRVTCKESLQVIWQIHDKTISNNSQAHKYCKLVNTSHPTWMGKDCDMLLINDIVGVRSNSSSKYLTYVPSRNKLFEIVFSINQGQYIWQATC